MCRLVIVTRWKPRFLDLADLPSGTEVRGQVGEVHILELATVADIMVHRHPSPTQPSRS
jgi:hypothetical protein